MFELFLMYSSSLKLRRTKDVIFYFFIFLEEAGLPAEARESEGFFT